MLFFSSKRRKNPISHESYLVKVGEKIKGKMSAGILNCCISIKNALSFARKTQDFLQGAQKLFVIKEIRYLQKVFSISLLQSSAFEKNATKNRF